MMTHLESTLDYAVFDSLWAEYRTRCSCCKREILASNWDNLKIKVQYHLVSMDCAAIGTEPE